MTREEAATILYNQWQGFLEDNLDYAGISDAYKIAIKTLNQEPKTGHWIYTLEDWNKWECSECGFTKRTDIHVNIGYKYCPECGARMIKEVEE